MKATFEAGLRDLIAALPGGRLRHAGVAVSGGGDSMALLGLMHGWALDQEVRLSAVTVDHGLRVDSAAEAAMVARFCAGRGIPHFVLAWQGWDGRGNLQAAARAARYRLMADWARARGVDAICLAHTRDDQAETFLMRLARKAGSDGLRGMRARLERHGVTWLRPLLPVGREELRVYLRREGIEWAEDPSNADEGFDRVKARKALACLAPLGIDAGALSAVARNLAAENEALRQATCAALHGRVDDAHGSLSIDLGDFRRLAPEFQRRFLAAAIGWIAGGEYPPRAASLAEMARALGRTKTHTLAGVIGWATKGRIWLAREFRAVRGLAENPFDGRWEVSGPDLAAREFRAQDIRAQDIRALGVKGLKQLPNWRESGLPRRVLLPLPAVWQGDRLVAVPAVPALRAGRRFRAIPLRPGFDKWLLLH